MGYRELLFFLVWRDLKVRYKQTALGVAWAVLQPLGNYAGLEHLLWTLGQSALRWCPLSHIRILRSLALADVCVCAHRIQQQSSEQPVPDNEDLFSEIDRPYRSCAYCPRRLCSGVLDDARE